MTPTYFSRGANKSIPRVMPKTTAPAIPPPVAKSFHKNGAQVEWEPVGPVAAVNAPIERRSSAPVTKIFDVLEKLLVGGGVDLVSSELVRIKPFSTNRCSHKVAGSRLFFSFGPKTS